MQRIPQGAKKAMVPSVFPFMPIFRRHWTPIERQQMRKVGGTESAWECEVKNDEESDEKRG